jgi:hypothetical protein
MPSPASVLQLKGAHVPLLLLLLQGDHQAASQCAAGPQGGQGRRHAGWCVRDQQQTQQHAMPYQMQTQWQQYCAPNAAAQPQWGALARCCHAEAAAQPNNMPESLIYNGGSNSCHQLPWTQLKAICSVAAVGTSDEYQQGCSKHDLVS